MSCHCAYLPQLLTSATAPAATTTNTVITTTTIISITTITITIIHHHYRLLSLLPPAAPASLPASSPSPSAHRRPHPNGPITIPRTSNTSPVGYATNIPSHHINCHRPSSPSHRHSSHTPTALTIKNKPQSHINQQCRHHSNSTNNPSLSERKFIMEVRCTDMNAAKERSAEPRQSKTSFFR